MGEVNDLWSCFITSSVTFFIKSSFDLSIIKEDWSVEHDEASCSQVTHPTFVLIPNFAL